MNITETIPANVEETNNVHCYEIQVEPIQDAFYIYANEIIIEADNSNLVFRKNNIIQAIVPLPKLIICVRQDAVPKV